MLSYSEISQLSDRDLNEELNRSRDLLFRQKIGVKNRYLKDSHLLVLLKKHVARLLTAIEHRKKTGQNVEKSAPTVAKKLAEDNANIMKSQETKPEKKKVASKSDKAAESTEEVATKSEKDVKVKKVEEKGWFGGKKKSKSKEA